MFAFYGHLGKRKDTKLDDIDDAICKAQMPDAVIEVLLFFSSSRHMLAGTGSQPLFFMMEGATQARWRRGRRETPGTRPEFWL